MEIDERIRKKVKIANKMIALFELGSIENSIASFFLSLNRELQTKYIGEELFDFEYIMKLSIDDKEGIYSTYISLMGFMMYFLKSIDNDKRGLYSMGVI